MVGSRAERKERGKRKVADIREKIDKEIVRLGEDPELNGRIFTERMNDFVGELLKVNPQESHIVKIAIETIEDQVKAFIEKQDENLLKGGK